MNKTEYMQELSQRLRHLPKDDFDKAIDYYEEYFADAGTENEAQVIEDLGTPEFAARQLVTTIAINNTKEPADNVKKRLNAVWVGILAVCAAPIALPMAFVLVVLIAVFILVIFILLASIAITGASLIITTPVSIAAGCTVLGTSFPVFISCLGIGLLSGGTGLLICYAAWFLCRSFLTGLIHFFGHLVQKNTNLSQKGGL